MHSYGASSAKYPKVGIACLFLASLGRAYAQSPSPPPQAQGYSLAFDEEFVTQDLSPNDTGVYTWYQGIWFDHVPAPVSNFNWSAGQMALTWMPSQASGDTSMTTLSPSKLYYQSFRYGYIEAKMKWDVVTGAWPAFWMIPVQDANGTDEYNGTKEAGELDIFEGQGAYPNIYYGTIHNWVNNTNAWSNVPNYYKLPASNDFSQFHTYGVLWVPPTGTASGQVTWYYDNKPILTAPTPAIFDQQNFYLVLGMQGGVNWQEGNRTGITATEMTLTVDYVRVWQNLSTSSTSTLIKPVTPLSH
jgi:hypothetical protein